MADPSRSTQAVLLVLAEQGGKPRATQDRVLGLVEQGGKPRSTQSKALAITEGGGIPRSTQERIIVPAVESAVVRATDATVIVLALPPAPARDTHAVLVTPAVKDALPRVTQSSLLAMRDRPLPIRDTQSDIIAPTEGTPVTRATQALVRKLGTSLAAPRSTQSQVRAVTAGDSVIRDTQSVVIVLSRDQCLTVALADGEMTFEFLKRRVSKLLAEERDKPVYWSEAEIERSINDAYRRVCRDTKCYEFVANQNTADGTQTYTLDSKTIQIIRVTADDVPLVPMTQWEMDRQQHKDYPSDDVWGYTLEPNQQVNLSWTPQGVQDLEVWAVGNPADMSLYCDAPEVPCWAQQAIAFGAAATLLAKRGEQGEKRLAGAYEAIYGDYIGLLKGHVANRSGEKAHGLR